MEEAIARGWFNLLGRLDGPMHFRFIVQPAVAMFLGICAGIRDARAGEAPLFKSLWHAEHRRARLLQCWADVGKVFVVAAALDAIYQVRVNRGIFLLELLATATLLALVPYALVRGPARRVAGAWLLRRS